LTQVTQVGKVIKRRSKRGERTRKLSLLLRVGLIPTPKKKLKRKARIP